MFSTSQWKHKYKEKDWFWFEQESHDPLLAQIQSLILGAYMVRIPEIREIPFKIPIDEFDEKFEYTEIAGLLYGD